MNFYRNAAEIIDRVDRKQGSVKGCLALVDEKQRKRTAALVIETLKFRPCLRDVIDATPLLAAEKKLLDPGLALVLVHDLLFAKGGIQAQDGPLKQAVIRHKTRLQAEWVKLKIKRGAIIDADLAQIRDIRAESIPRYVRVNTNRIDLPDAIASLSKEGFVKVETENPLSGKAYMVDPHVQNLLLFPPDTSFETNELYRTGKIILQDKASCFPALILDPPANSEVVDATSAPGNKTSHLSALMGNTGRIFAFERDRRRYETLRGMVSKAGCKNVETLHEDFLHADPRDPRFASVTHILVDPSCSGSGIVNRLDYLVESGDDSDKEDRLKKLSDFQVSMVRHALKFISAVKVVYSTCSVYEEENEQVVQRILESPEGTSKFELAPKSMVLPSWPRRGISGRLSEGNAERVLRCSPGEDATNGFFVACFVRVGSSHYAPSSHGIDQAIALLDRHDGSNQKSSRKRKRLKSQYGEEYEEWEGIAD